MRKLVLLAVLGLFLIGFSGSGHGQSQDAVVVLHTGSGKLVMEFFDEEAPNHVDNFIRLAGEGFYDRTVFHRIIPGFMIQGGDPQTKPGAYESTAQWGTGNPGYQIDAEFNDISHVRGIVSMARSNDPDSAGSQFFVVHRDSTFLDGAYTVFGRLVTEESFETLDRIAQLDTPFAQGTAPQNEQGATIPVSRQEAEILRAEVLSKSEVDGLIEPGEPARVEGITTPPESQAYSNERLGIEFTAPVGWLLQEPQKSRPDVPDIVAVTQGTDGINTSISVTISYSGGRSLDDKISGRMQDIRPALDSGSLELVSEEKTELYGRESFVLLADGTFDDDDTAVNVRFHEVTFLENEKFYTLTYTASEGDYESHLDEFDQAVKTFRVLGAQGQTRQDGGGGCLVATAAYGSEMAPQVQLLREVRDNTVLGTQSGSAFMAGFGQLYYSFSPTVADWERQSPAFREAVRMAITPLVSTLAILSHVDIGSEHEMLGYGLGVIAINVGMYLVAPAMIIRRILRRYDSG